MKTILKVFSLILLSSVISCNTQKRVVKNKESTDSISTTNKSTNILVDSARLKKEVDSYDIRIVTKYKYDTIRNQVYIDSIVYTNKGVINKYDTNFHRTQVNIIDSNITMLNKQIESLEKNKKTTTPITTYIIWILVALLVIWLLYNFLKRK